jgi:glycosyltransferase involved in cell wall biosynthesis
MEHEASCPPKPNCLLVLTAIDLDRGLPQRTHHLVRVLSTHASLTVVDIRGVRRRNDWWYKLSHAMMADVVRHQGGVGDRMTVEAAFSAFSRLAPVSDVQIIRFLCRAAKSAGQRWDVCLAQGPICGAAASMLKRQNLFDTLVYEDLDDFPAFFPFRPIERRTVALLENWSLHSADLVIAVSEVLAGRAGARGARQIAVVPNGADWRMFDVPLELPPPGSTVYVGSLEPWAGLELAVEAVALLRRRGQDATLRIYGRGSPADEARLKHAIERSGAGASISLGGVVAYTDLPRVVTQARVGLIPFVPGPLAAHAFPLKLVEYMSGGLNVVGTRVGELGRFLNELPGGLAADLTAVSFAEAIEEMSEALTIDQMAANRAAVASFDWHELGDREWKLISDAWCRSSSR